MDKTIGERIEELLEQKGHNQSDLARAIGVSSQTIQQWISGKTTPKEANLKKTASFLSVTAEFIRYGDNERSSSSDDEELAQLIDPSSITLDRLDLIKAAADIPEELIPHAKTIFKALADKKSVKKRSKKTSNKDK